MPSPDIAAIEKRLKTLQNLVFNRQGWDNEVGRLRQPTTPPNTHPLAPREVHLVTYRTRDLRCYRDDIRALLDRVKELEANRGQWIALARRAATDSCITTDDGPGCFFCDYEEHTKDCPYDALLTGVVNEEASDE